MSDFTISAALEDYLGVIFRLSGIAGAARPGAIAKELGVHKSTVTAALKSLGRMNFVNYSPYEAVTLTTKGVKLAEDVVKRHTALKDFFINILEIDTEIAERAACSMEHSVPRPIVDKLIEYANPNPTRRAVLEKR